MDKLAEIDRKTLMSFSLYYHPLYSDGLDRTARFPVDRYRLLKEKLCPLDEGKGIIIKTPRLAKFSELCLVHEEEYVSRFLEGSLSDKEIRRIGLKPWKAEIIPRTLRLVGGALDGLEELLKGAKYLCGSVSLMNIKVKNEDTLYAISLQSRFGANGQVVKNTVTRSFSPKCMMRASGHITGDFSPFQ